MALLVYFSQVFAGAAVAEQGSAAKQGGTGIVDVSHLTPHTSNDRNLTVMNGSGGTKMSHLFLSRELR